MKRQVLGKGLDALLPKASPASSLAEIDIERIQPSGFQPRMQFESERLDELARSIAENGILQPIVVRKSGDQFEIVAGERRWRAAQRAGLARIPAIIQDVSDEKMVELALVENIQRDELSPIEEAHAYQLLSDQFSLTQEEIARRVGKSRVAVANTLRLLRLPKNIQQALLSGELSMGHARALLPLSTAEQLKLAQQIFARGWSVREVERRVQQMSRPQSTPRFTVQDPNVGAAQRRLEEKWKTRVEIRRRGRSGHIALFFHSPEELERLYLDLLGTALPQTGKSEHGA
ncbi:MAG: ParB/RepB/Spo0J family partition protein [Acidobacteria bacterium]|nr:ParB/RepB/Spo0J family partition protein [Acidobacteriota bacterium]